MKKYKIGATALILFIGTIALYSCGDGGQGASDNSYEAEADKDTVEIVLNSNDKMQFDKTEINIYEDQTVVLTLNHTGTMPVSSMGHNFVLLANGISVSSFAKEALKAKENEYIPTNSESVIAHTALIGGGESDVVIFQAPNKGEYDFLCSFPGHYSIMKGKLNVK